MGWYHSSMKATEEVCAAYLNQSLDGFDKHLQAVAIECARNSPFDDVLPAAARLIMLPDLDTAEQPAATVVEDRKSGGDEFEGRIKALLKTSQPTQAQLLDLLLNHLHDDLHLTRVVLMLLSKDKTRLGTRAGRGIDEHSPIRTLVIDINRESLLKKLLGKQQSLWVEPDNYDKYESALPTRFKESFLHESFFLISMFVANKPVGMIFGDRARGVNRLDKSSYEQFKSAIRVTCQALTYLVKRRRDSRER